MTDMTVGVYVHVPFCERVCPYCDFAVVAARPLTGELENRYVSALLLELAARRADYAGRQLASLYLGGGTPSLLSPESIDRIVRAVDQAFPQNGPSQSPSTGPEEPGRVVTERIETTLEVNPSTLERSRLPEFRAAGVNRVSVGVQSFDDRVLQRLGRAHRADEAHRTLRACREAGFDAISLDLIFAAPSQSPDGFAADLAAALDFGPEHVSTYELTVEPGTPFELAARRGQLDLPGEDEALEMMATAEAQLTAAGYQRYEISNYARLGFAAVHNRRYWQRRPVLGIGMGAFSTAPAGPGAPYGSRRANLRDLYGYLARVVGGHPAAARPDEVFTAATARGEAVFLALRDALGLDAAGFAAEFGEPPRGFFAEPIGRLAAAGLLEESKESGDLRLTARGRLLSDTVFAEFV